MFSLQGSFSVNNYCRWVTNVAGPVTHSGMPSGCPLNTIGYDQTVNFDRPLPSTMTLDC